MRTAITTILAGASLGLTVAQAAPIDFDFKDPKGVNNIVFQLDAPLESINGTGTGITGNVSFDPGDPTSIAGSIVLDVNSLTVPNSTMQGHLVGPRWLDTAAHSTIIFEAVSAANARTVDGSTLVDLTGNLTIKGVTKQMTVPVKITYLKGKLKARGGTDGDGDLLVLRSSFFILRDAFGINPGQSLEKVPNEIELTLSLVGIAPY